MSASGEAARKRLKPRFNLFVGAREKGVDRLSNHLLVDLDRGKLGAVEREELRTLGRRTGRGRARAEAALRRSPGSWSSSTDGIVSAPPLVGLPRSVFARQRAGEL
jgi:hypothetical protein